ncbi:hypothetical protein [Wolbachia endosymbiont (group B) of Limnophora tigrina]|uniref:hypothetical protein n=1 Tax=Wolbachia endosymbiont (group B) of Limnophora tigrina TaxID=3139317 RepID=UPI0035B525B7
MLQLQKRSLLGGCHPSLGSSFLYKFTKSASFYNAKPILTKPNALLTIKIPGSQCQLLG